MRYSAEHKQQTRERIVKAAARRFRGRGSEGAAIGDLMKDLRLTHGGFYRHFSSKENLFLEVFHHSLTEIRRRVGAAVAEARPGDELEALIGAYLGPEHCADPAGGCPLAALGPEIARRPRRSRAAFERLLADHIRLIAKYVPGDTESDREHKALVLLSGMSGTLTVARMMTDDARRGRLLSEAIRFYLDAARR